MQINTDTSCLGLIGNPLKHSLSPLMHNAVLQKMGLNYVYLPFEVQEENLGAAVAAIRGLNLKGVNVTIPFKEKVIPYLDDLSEEAAFCGAVNVINNEKGRLIGYNTDGRGFIAALKDEDVAVKGSALFIGAGGAARSLACELSREGISQITFLDLNYDKAEELAQFIAAKKLCTAAAEVMHQDTFAALGAKADIIINCSPVGMYPHSEQSPVSDLSRISPEAVLCDVIYNPLTTTLLRMGQERKLKTVSGLSMFVYQGVLTLEIILGIKPPIDYMKEVVRIQLGK